MNEHHREVEEASTTEGLPVAPSLGPAIQLADVPLQPALANRRVVYLSCLAVLNAIVAAVVAQGLIHLIAFITHLSFFGELSANVATARPERNHLGPWVVVIPVIGAFLVGLLARYGSKAIRGHGIPEAMEQVLVNQSRIPARLTFLKPLSAAIAIGTGGPFGAEGPIIATGGALGSLMGQLLRTTAAERKTLLAAGAAAGMAATFGSPVSAVLLAIELLLFEFRARSIIPVALASATAAAVRFMFDGASPVFEMSALANGTGASLAFYMFLGAVVGVASVGVTRAVYAVEDLFEHLPVHWMWWPAIGAIAVGVVGYFAPRTLGVGYYNITDILSNQLTASVVGFLILMKFISWCVALGSGTSGGTLAPLFTLGGGLGLLLGMAASHVFPYAGIDPRIAALVGMAAMFAGASRALLTSAVFAFETTLQPLGLLPLLGGCSVAYLMSCLLMRHTIMTEKIARRGIRVPADYAADFFEQVSVREAASRNPVTLRGSQTVGEVRDWIYAGDGAATRHQGFPVVDDAGLLEGVLTRRDILDPHQAESIVLGTLIRRPPIVVYANLSLREAADHMVNHDIGRLPVVERESPGKVIGMLTRSDLLAAHRQRLRENHEATASIGFGKARPVTGS